MKAASPPDNRTMPAPVSSLARTLHLMRLELTQARQQPQGARSAATAGAGAPAEGPSPAAQRVAVLRGRLKAARAMPGGLTRARALRLFVEAALLDEWGQDLQLDPGFHDVVERTCQTLEADGAQADLLAAALAELEALG